MIWKCCGKSEAAKGIENYSSVISERSACRNPALTRLMDYFPDDFLILIDESHVMLPQLRAMYAGDRFEEKSLVDYGFRLPSALDNRPLKFEEFQQLDHQVHLRQRHAGPYEREHRAEAYGGTDYPADRPSRSRSHRASRDERDRSTT